MIPKIIHYCWFGGAEITSEYAGYIAEWQALHPDWEIIRWNEANSPVDNIYLHNALSLKNWANASNFTRLWALKHFGGIYLDTDFKLIKPLDSFLNNTCFLGFESGSDTDSVYFVNNAVLGCIAESSFVKKCLESLLATYDGSEEAHLSSPHLTTKILNEEYGLNQYGDQVLNEIRLYDKVVFYPLPFARVYDRKNFMKYCQPNTVGVHMWGRTWLSKETMLAAIDELQSWSQDLLVYIEDLKIENAWLKGNLDVEQENVNKAADQYQKLKAKLEKQKKQFGKKEIKYQKQLSELSKKALAE